MRTNRCELCGLRKSVTEFKTPRSRKCIACLNIKQCVVCNTIKPIDQFEKPKSYKCADCLREARKQYHANWYQLNTDKIKTRRATPESKLKKSINDRRYYLKHRNDVLTTNRQYAKAHKQRRNQKQRERTKIDPMYRLNKNIRNRIYTSLLKNKDGKHWESLVSYTLDDLRSHLEKQFVDGMCWNNYGKWVIDHIQPIVSFNITDFSCADFKACWSLSNLRPLWDMDNIIKSRFDKKAKNHNCTSSISASA